MRSDAPSRRWARSWSGSSRRSKAGKFVVIAHGTRDEVEKGRTVLAEARITTGRHTAAEREDEMGVVSR